jgi:hypothetical protein
MGQFETAIAGSKGFALALFAPLTERVGTRPRVAADPGQAAALLPQSGLVIVELQSPAWLSAVQRLAAERPARSGLPLRGSRRGEVLHLL